MPAPRQRLRVHTLIDSLTWGGAEALLADFAAAAPEAGIDLTVGYLQDIDGSPSARRLRAAGVEPDLLGTGRLLDPRAHRTVRDDLARRRPDVLHTHLDSADVLGGLAARSLGIPLVCTVHLAEAAVTDAGGVRGRVKRALIEQVRERTTTRIVAVSDAAREAYLRRTGADPAQAVTVHNGIVARPAARPRDAVRDELGIPRDAVLIAMVSVLRARKGHDVAIPAVAQLAQRHPGVVLLCIGDGPAREEIAALAAPHGARVMLAGHRDDVPDLLGAADLLVHPTAMDAFPTVLLEAGSAGLPVVATAVGGIPEIVVDGQTGVLVGAPPQVADVAAALEPLVADAGLRARYGDAARRRYGEHFTAAAWAQRLRDLYDEVAVGSQR